MSWIDLGNPAPLEAPQMCVPRPWPEGKVRLLSDEHLDVPATFQHIASTRHSRRDFYPSEDPRLGQLLDMTCRARTVISHQLGFPQTSRPAPSAGAIHPVHVILHRFDDPGWSRYDPMKHALIELPSSVTPSSVRRGLNEVLPGAAATIILFAAEPALTFAKYRHACSLIWRDAGVLQGFFSAAAEALALNCCLLGVTGEPWVSRLVEQKTLIGVGAAYVGSSS